ncbi:hypothetical protein [Desulfotignum phosphitoxidans]|nr:hypothetical protein [Desulfotignum phosphitoxidans]
MKRSHNTFSAKKLNEIEVSLNHLNYKGLEIGSMLSYYFNRMFLGDFDFRLFRHFSVLVYYFLKPVNKNKYLKDLNKSVVYFTSGKHRHLKEIEGIITEEEQLLKKTIVFGPGKESDTAYRYVFCLSGVLDFFKVILFFISRQEIIIDMLKPLNLNIKTKMILCINLLTQLLKAYSLKKFIALQKNVKLIAGDYDRGKESSLFFAVAKALNIKSVVFQHGVINHQAGYAPVNADEIWVWGDMARLQLSERGVPKKKIKVTGTPIIEDIEISSEFKYATQKKYNIESGKTIVLALSAPNKANDMKMVRFLSEIKEKYAKPNDNFFVKIHPARKFYAYSWIQNDFNISLLPQNIDYKEFVTIVDILLVYNSGIATEMLYYKKTVGVLDIWNNSFRNGNGHELNRYFSVPLLKKPEDFETIISEVNIPDSKKVFCRVGKEAKSEMRHLIKMLLT